MSKPGLAAVIKKSRYARNGDVRCLVLVETCRCSPVQKE